jgi:hypothetical protein
MPRNWDQEYHQKIHKRNLKVRPLTPAQLSLALPLSVYPSVCLSFSVPLSVCPSLSLCLSGSAPLSVCPALPLCLSVCPSLSLCPSVRPSLCPSVRPSLASLPSSLPLSVWLVPVAQPGESSGSFCHGWCLSVPLYVSLSHTARRRQEEQVGLGTLPLTLTAAPSPLSRCLSLHSMDFCIMFAADRGGYCAAGGQGEAADGDPEGGEEAVGQLPGAGRW